MSTYTKSLSTDFGGELNARQFHDEITDSSITTTLVGINQSGDVVNINFVSALSGPDETTLNTLITNHVPHPDEWERLTFITITSADSPYSVHKKSILCDTSGGNIILQLKPVTDAKFVPIGIKKTSASNTLTIDPYGSELIDSSTTKNITSLNASFIITHNDTEWFTSNPITSACETRINEFTYNKGDIVTDNGLESVALSVGTNNHVLTADSAQKEGIKWAQVDHTNLSNIGSNTHSQIDTHISNSIVHGISGNVVGTSDTQTLTNKTINSANNTITLVAGDITPHEGSITHDNLNGFVSNEHIDHSTISISAGTGLSGGGDLTSSRTINMDINSLTSDTNPDPANDYVLSYDTSVGGHKKILLNNLPGAIGEANTVSNIGSSGVGVYKQKTGVNFELKKIDVGSTKLAITDDTINDIVSLDVQPGFIDISTIGGSGLSATKIADGSVSNTEFQYINSLSSNVQDQINTHTGDTSNPHSVTKAQVGLGDVPNIKHKLDATVAPVDTNDTSEGYSVGSMWIDVNNDESYLCVDNTTANAIWKELANESDCDIMAFDAYDNTGGQSTTGEIVINIDTERKNTGHFTLTNDEVTIGTGGTFIVNIRAGTDLISGSTRSSCQCWLERDSGSGFVKIPGSDGYMYNRTSSVAENSAHVTVILDLNSGDKLRLKLYRIAGQAVATISGGSSITLYNLNNISGVDGESNTVSNLGSGVGVYKTKNGVNLEFKSINSGSNKISITDDTSNNEVDIDVVENNINVNNLSGIPTGSIVGTTDTQTLTNKTITGSTNTVEATQLSTTGSAVVISGASQPSIGQILRANSTTTAIWDDENIHPYEMNGFINPADCSCSFTNATRTFTIQPAVSSFSFFSSGNKYTKTTAQNIVISDTEGLHAFYFDSDGVLQSATNPSSSTVIDVIMEYAIIAWLYWDATNSQQIYFTGTKELHGYQMSGETHAFLHRTLGSQYISGMALNTLSVDGSGNVNASAQFGVDVGLFLDEDITVNTSAVTSTTGLPIFYKDGASGNWRRQLNTGYSVLTTGTGRLAYNQWTGSLWQLTEVTNGDFVLYHIFASNDSTYPYISIMGQNMYTTSGDARLGAVAEINSLQLSGLPFQEFVPVGTVIFQARNTYTNAVKGRIISTDEGDDYVDFRNMKISPESSATDHSNLSGLNDDDHLQYSLLNGRSTGQILTGGTDATDDLVLRSTSNASKGKIHIDETTGATSKDTGALVVEGGVGIEENLYVGGNLIVTGTNNTLTLPKTFRIGHTWGISGAVNVASGDNDFISPFFYVKASNQSSTIIGCVYKINSGTSVTAKIQINDADVTGLTNISITPTTNYTISSSGTLSNMDKIALIVTAVSGSPKNLTFTLFLDHTV
jgi:hypothetical protein